MSMIDYGGLLRVDGNLVNRNQFFMKSSDTGYICKTAIDSEGNVYDIDGNYFVYSGDENFLLCFYKTICLIVNKEKIIKLIWNITGDRETFFFNNLPNVRIEYLDKSFKNYYYDKPDEYDIEYLKHKYGAKWKLHYRRRLKHSRRISYKERSEKYLATWEHNGHKYKCIYGYGIDSDKDVYDSIKYGNYGYTDVERKVIDSWFTER